jgi:hypothetical protein
MTDALSVICEIDFGIVLNLTLSPFSELFNTKFCVKWTTDYSKGEAIANSNGKGILVFPRINFRCAALGSRPDSFESRFEVEVFFHKEGHAHCYCTKKLGSNNKVNIAEKVKLSSDIANCQMEQTSMKFFYLSETDKQSYASSLLTKVDIKCNLIRCRLGNDYYKRKGDSWITSTEAENFDLGISFRDGLMTLNNAERAKNNTEGKSLSNPQSNITINLGVINNNQERKTLSNSNTGKFSNKGNARVTFIEGEKPTSDANRNTLKSYV